MTTYDCCGLKYEDGKTLTDHMRADHSLPQFAVALSCCGTEFKGSRQLSEHMKAQHKIALALET
ncbi:MAG: hypothetical protein OK474_00495 [Thaumarchaeota archaeon]|nr:hypothetical protein [Nitrososphaerota archaeon]